MTLLINESDRNVLKHTKFFKNAYFYKDMFAFFDAYSKIMNSEKENLPSYCFYENGNYCLEGICLVIKNYASEFNFESLKLTLDYLKVLYFSIASFSNDENMPNRDVIENEYKLYQDASLNIAKEAKTDYDLSYINYYDAKKEHEKLANKYAHKIVASRLANIFSIILMIFSFGLGVIPFIVYSYGKIALWLTSLLGACSIILGTTVYFLLKRTAAKLEEQSGMLLYTLSQKKHKKDNFKEVYCEKKNQYSKILSEKYEYKTNFNNSINLFIQEKLSIEQILTKAKEFKLVTFNLKKDLTNLFDAQQNEINGVIRNIEAAPNTFEQHLYLNDCYKEIVSVDHLFYNNQVRFAFLKKFIENAEKNYVWKVNLDGKKVNPFNIDIKNIAKEKITYLKDENSLFVESNLDKFLKTKYIQNTGRFKLNRIKNQNDLKIVKGEYILHFYDYALTKNYDNLFYEKKITDGARVNAEIIEKTQKIPTLIMMKLKYIQCRLGLENSNYQIISKIANDIESTVVDVDPEDFIESIDDDVSDDAVMFDYVIEDTDTYVKYNIRGDVVVGYKFA